jgi:gas vesicle protein
MLQAQLSAQNISLRVLYHLQQGVTAMSTSGKITALVAGSAVIGAGLGLLLAPQTGSETRRQVRQYAKRTQDQAARLSRSVQAGFTRVIEHGKSLQDTAGCRSVEAA